MTSRERFVFFLLWAFVGSACLTYVLAGCRETPTATEKVAKAGAPTIATGQSYVRLHLNNSWTYTTEYVKLVPGYSNGNFGVYGHRLDGTTQFHLWSSFDSVWGYFDNEGPGEYLGEMYLYLRYANGVEDVEYTWALRAQQALFTFYPNGNGAVHPLSDIVEIQAYPEDGEPPSAPKNEDPYEVGEP